MRRNVWNWDRVEGVVKQRSRYHAPENRVELETTVITDQAVAEVVKQAQNGERLHGIGTFAGDWLCVPYGVVLDELQVNPALASNDPATKSAELRRLRNGKWRIWKIPTGRGYVRGGLAH